MPSDSLNALSIPRRDFLKLSAAAVGALGAMGADALRGDPPPAAASDPGAEGPRAPYNGPYEGPRLNRIAFPLGGIGAGMICLEGTGAISHVSVQNRPDVYNEPCSFAAVSVAGRWNTARVLEGPVPGWKLFGMRESANGGSGKSYGLPRFTTAQFLARFPFATVSMTDPHLPLAVELTGWSPFVPGDADSSSLPVAALEYRFTNRSTEAVDAVFSFNARNFMAPTPKSRQSIRHARGGFVLWAGGSAGQPWEEGAFAATVAEPGVKVNLAWFRGAWFDPLTMAWNGIEKGEYPERAPPADNDGPSPGATLAVPFRLQPGASRVVALNLCWYAGKSDLREPVEPPPAAGDAAKSLAPDRAGEARYRPWYAGRYPNIDELIADWQGRCADFRARSENFSRCFYDTTLPAEVVEAVAANLSILKSPTLLRQTDGRLWAWEGCSDEEGCCYGSCTHVWNYAQANAHLFPGLERSLRETEFGPSQDERGHQVFRSALPIRPLGPKAHEFPAAADGQLGGIMKVYREWRISGDTGWLRTLWPKVRLSLDYCIETWDPKRRGWVEEPHHNTYDIEFWGPDGMCTSFYLGALTAAVKMGEALGDENPAYRTLLAEGRRRAETELFDGEYFIQKIEWKNLQAHNPQTSPSYGGEYSPEALALLRKEGPKYQYGTGCLSDGVLGSWIALACGVGQVLDPGMVASHLRAVHNYNLKKDLSEHSNPQRPTYACGAEGGLLLCTWPKGGEPSLPFVYSNEVWTGIEYQVASHLMLMGRAAEGLEIVRTCRDRYDGRIRNPFDEYECGHWYARALSSYGLLQGLSGARYDAIEKSLYLAPSLAGDFRSFIATATGYGVVGVRAGQPFVEVRSGSIEVTKIHYVAAASA